jgi:uroporphyrinogen decarboxylase
MMTSRERVLCALSHEEPDRVPLMVGGGGATTLLAQAQDRLKEYLGLAGETRVTSRAFGYSLLSEEVYERLHSDVRTLAPEDLPLAAPVDSEDSLTDQWGIGYVKKPGVWYYEPREAPLCNASLDDIPRYPWPDLSDPARVTGMAERGRRMHARSDCAIVGLGNIELVELIELLRGFDQWCMDLASDHDFVHAMLRTVTELMLQWIDNLLGAIGPHIDLLTVADDLGMQGSPKMSPSMYRQLIKPYHAEIMARIKQRTRAKICFHSCGDVYPLIGDFIDIGVDILNPVQVSAREMGDTARLKREFGRNIAFCGGVDTQRIMPRGTTDEVRAEVRRRLRDLAPGGGYLLAAVHCIQPDVPPENILAMCDEAVASGGYPLTP